MQIYLKKINFATTTKPSKFLSFGLIEVMIAASILSLGLLGVAFIQSKAFHVSREASMHETAVRLIEQLSSFMITMTPTEILSILNNPATVTSTCLGSYCNRLDFFAALKQNWLYNIGQLLPAGKGCICIASTGATNPVVIRTAIQWKTLAGTIKTKFFENQFLSDIAPSGFYCPSAASSTNVCSF